MYDIAGYIYLNEKLDDVPCTKLIIIKALRALHVRYITKQVFTMQYGFEASLLSSHGDLTCIRNPQQRQSTSRHNLQ